MMNAKINPIPFSNLPNSLLEQLGIGAFLTVLDKSGRLNTMTIAWGSIGIMWRLPVLTVMVRPNRYTHELIENADNFTVSFPEKGTLKEALGICGSKSGRDTDKLKAASLTTIPSLHVATPIIAECKLHVECKMIYKQTLDPTQLPIDFKEKLYFDNSFHTLYYGEILDSYALEK